MLQYKMYPAGELRCPTTALVLKIIGGMANSVDLDSYFGQWDSFFSEIVSKT